MNEKTAEKVYKRHLKITEMTDAKNETDLVLGKYLYEMKETEEYKVIAGDDSTFTSYLADPEISVSVSKATRLMRIHIKYILELEMTYTDLRGIDTYKLQRIAKEITPENKDEWISRARTLSRSDIARLLEYPDVDPMTCQHLFKPHKEKCGKCGEVQGIKK